MPWSTQPVSHYLQLQCKTLKHLNGLHSSPFFSALCYCCHLVPFVNSKLLATTPILERTSYGKGSECLRVNCKHPLKEDSDVLVGRGNKLSWTKVYKGSELRGDWDGRNEKLAASPLSSEPDKTAILRKLPGKESIPHFGKVIWREMKAELPWQPHRFSALCFLCQLSSTFFQERGLCVLEYV